jgi:L-alanine-DL-glutamate epimerase-like enolase superfamily enzyme
MKIEKIEHLHVDGGWTVMSYLKITTDKGLTGWSEYSGHQALPGVIDMMAARAIGKDPCNINAIDAALYTFHRPAPGGLAARAMGAILNACLDIKGKAWGVPVYDLLGGRVQTRLPLYWSHVGLFRAGYQKLFDEVIGSGAVRDLDGFRRAGEEVAARGFSALKTNLVRFGPDGFILPADHHQPSLNIDRAIIDTLTAQLTALRDGAGSGVAMMLDVNFNYKAEGFRQLARAVEPFELVWIEMDMPDPKVLAGVRNSSSTPIASLEMQLGRRALRPFLENQAVDVAIIDAQWNGLREATIMAQLADGFDVNVAAHCSAGPLGARMSAHFCAATPNFRIMEHEVDVMPWHESLLTDPNIVEHGAFILSDRPGWGTDIDETVARAHPGANGPSGRRGT